MQTRKTSNGRGDFKMKTFKTKLGTELPLMNLKGKDYLQVAHRIQWFREEHPDGIINTDIVFNDGKNVIVRAQIIVDNLIVSTAHKMDALAPDMIERAETGSVGRALGFYNYGTQFADLNEGDRLADAPINSSVNQTPDFQEQDFDPYPPPFDSIPDKPVAKPKNEGMKRYNHAPQANNGIYVIEVGKFKGKEINSIPYNELKNYINFIKRKANEEGKPLSGKMKELEERFLDLESKPLSTNDLDGHLDQPPGPDFNEQLPF